MAYSPIIARTIIVTDKQGDLRSQNSNYVDLFKNG